jgi:hypothetical protein
VGSKEQGESGGNTTTLMKQHRTAPLAARESDIANNNVIQKL